MKRSSLIMNAFRDAAESTVPRLAWKASTPAEHARWRRRFRDRLERLLGRTPPAVPLRVEWGERLVTPAFVRRKVYIRSEPRYWIPAYLYVPRKASGPRPAVICLHGHSGVLPYIREGSAEERAKGRALKIDYAPWLAEHGYVTLVPVQRGWNETMHPTDPTVRLWNNCCYRMAQDAFLTGMTPIGLRVWDCRRLVDFLQTRPEVDSHRIAAAGISGGGTSTLFFAALDRRVRLAIVSGFFSTYRDSIFEIWHCICNCVPGIMEWADMSDVAALIAPRPLLVMNGRQDPIFPFAATRRAYARLHRTYARLGAADRLWSDFFEGGHEWSNRRTLPFLDRHFDPPQPAGSRRRATAAIPG